MMPTADRTHEHAGPISKSGQAITTSSAIRDAARRLESPSLFTLQFLFKCAMNISYRVLRSRSRKCIEQFRKAHLVRITDRGLAIWLDPIGVLNPQVVVNLLPEFGIGVNSVSYTHLTLPTNREV